jgi:hypothetical protein
VSKFEAKSLLLVVAEKVEVGRHPADVIASNEHPETLAGPIGVPQGFKRLGIAKGILEVPDIIDEYNEEPDRGGESSRENCGLDFHRRQWTVRSGAASGRSADDR